VSEGWGEGMSRLRSSHVSGRLSRIAAIRSHPDAVALLAIGVVALAVRLAFLYRVPVLLTGDSQSHFLPAFDLIHGNTFDPELRRPPGYALFAAGTMLLLGEDLRAITFVQQVLGVATALLAYGLGRVTFGRASGLLAGLLVALNGALIVSGQSIMTETLFTFVLLGVLLVLLQAGRSGRYAWALLAGILLGVAALVRPVAQILVLLVPLTFLLYDRRLWPILRGTVLVGVGVLLVMGPWMLRNASEHGTLSAAGGRGRSLIARTIKYDEGFFDDALPEAAPDDLNGQVRQFIRGKRNTIRNSRSVRSTQAGLMSQFNLTQAESDRLMRQVALGAIAEHPIYYAVGNLGMSWQIVLGKEKEDTYSDRLVMRRDKDWGEQWEDRLDFLLTQPTETEQRSVETAQWLSGIFQPATVGPILPILAAIGIGLALAVCQPALVPGAAGLLLLLASASLDGPVPRYRYPLDPLLALFAAGAVVTIVRWALTAPRWRRVSQPIPGGASPLAEASR
jgi:4-amino-4-deoxy-L-arabinose transferase-like glycosyltransferase